MLYSITKGKLDIQGLSNDKHHCGRQAEECTTPAFLAASKSMGRVGAFVFA